MDIIKNKSIVGNALIHTTFILFCLTCIIPIVAIASISFSNTDTLVNFGYRLIPVKLDFEAYKYIFDAPGQIVRSYGITIFITIAGTFLSLLANALIAYPLSRKEFKLRNKITLFIFFPMLFNGGLVPWYMLISQYLHMKNNILVLIVPYIASAWNVLLLRTYFQKIPVELFEAADMDGANELYIFFRIVLPLSKPSLATVGFLTSLAYWNDWWLALLFIDNDGLLPIQYLLQRLMSNIQFLATILQNSSGTNINMDKFPDENARMAMCLLAAGPMLFMFQVFQKYFVEGMMVGSIKG